MNRRLLVILFSAFIIAALSAYLVWRVVEARVAAVQPVPTTSVVAASGDIKIGSVLSSSDLKTIQIAGSVPEGAILKPEGAIGRGVISALYNGEPILESRLAPLGSGGGLAATIRQGMRACAVRVDDVVGVAGFVTPGMRVDVLVSGVPPSTGNNQQTEVKTILQNIEVLSAGTDIQKDNEGKAKQVQVVNLLVTPEQAQTLALASSQHIQLVLRNPLDTKVAAVPLTGMSNLFENTGATPVPAKRQAAPRAVKTVPQAFTIQVINGSQRSEEKFASPGGNQ